MRRSSFALILSALICRFIVLPCLPAAPTKPCSARVCSVFFVAHLHLQLGDAPLQLEQLHVEGRLLASQRRNLLLDSRVLGLLVRVVAFHLFFDLEVFVGQRLAHLLRLHCQHTFQGLLLRAQHLHLFLMVLKLVRQLQDHFLRCTRPVNQIAG